MQYLGGALFIGPTPVAQGIERLEPELVSARAGGRLLIEAAVVGSLGILEALRARFDKARAYLERRTSIWNELGLAYSVGLSARPEAASEAFRRGYERLAGLGETGVSCTLAAMLGNALAALGDVDDALRFAQISEETGEEGDAVNQILLRTARARALERAGRPGEAEAIAREAAAIAMKTDFLYFQPFVLLDLAHVPRSAGKETEAVPVVEEAIELCERKGNVPLAERARSCAGGRLRRPGGAAAGGARAGRRGSSEDDLPLRLNHAQDRGDGRGLNPAPDEHGPAVFSMHDRPT